MRGRLATTEAREARQPRSRKGLLRRTGAYRLIRWTARQTIEPTRTTMRIRTSLASIGLTAPSRRFGGIIIAPRRPAEAGLDPFEGGL